MSKNKELAKDYFDRHPSSNECHVASDGRVFHNPGTAAGYAASLKNGTVDKFTRGENNQEESGSDASELTLEGYTPGVTTYEDAKKLVKALGLKPASQKKEDVFAALDAEKATAEAKAASDLNETKTEE